MRQRCHIVLGKILHYVERCIAHCVAMGQPPIVKNSWADTNNAYSQSCEDFHIKHTAFTVDSGDKNSLWITPC
ncbi:hypothetical protein TNCV_3148691 [Trichonephila clavipes]|nr:hypothetical protein TNCV_3148691 [Trichonephila clavipes]